MSNHSSTNKGQLSGELYGAWHARQDTDRKQAALGAFNSRLNQLRRSAALERDTAERRVARRVLAGLFVRAFEQADALRARREYAAAIGELQLAAALQPESPRPAQPIEAIRAEAAAK